MSDAHTPYVPSYEEHLADFMPKEVECHGHRFLRHENGDIEIAPAGMSAPITLSPSQWKKVTAEIGCGQSTDDLHHRYLQTLPLEKLTRAQYAELIGEWTRQIGNTISGNLSLIALYTAGMANHAPWDTQASEQTASVNTAQATQDGSTDPS
jgi:hypothetical protein